VVAPRSVAHTDELRDSAKAWMVDAVAVEQRSIQQLDLRCASIIRIDFLSQRSAYADSDCHPEADTETCRQDHPQQEIPIDLASSAVGTGRKTP
jgi:hypothetical protein